MASTDGCETNGDWSNESVAVTVSGFNGSNEVAGGGIDGRLGVAGACNCGEATEGALTDSPGVAADGCARDGTEADGLSTLGVDIPYLGINKKYQDVEPPEGSANVVARNVRLGGSADVGGSDGDVATLVMPMDGRVSTDGIGNVDAGGV